MEGSGWEEQVLLHEADVRQQLKSLVQNAKEKEVDKLQILTQQAAKNNIETIINEPIYNLNPQFWEEIREPYLMELRDLSDNCQKVLSESFRCSADEVNEFMEIMERDIHAVTKEIVKRLFRDINTNLLRKFNKMFKKDANEKNRNWREMEEAKIRELHATCKK